MERTHQKISDSRADQALRVADFLEKHPGSTVKEIDAACDLGCATKVLSAMVKQDELGMGYVISKGWRTVTNSHGVSSQRRTYTLLARPRRQPDLFTFIE